MEIALSRLEIAQLGEGIRKLEALSSRIALEGVGVAKPYERGDYGEKVWWAGADTVVFEPSQQLQEHAETRGDVVVETVHARALGATFHAIAEIAFELAAYDFQTKYDLWTSISSRCSDAAERPDVTESALCQTAIWEAIRVLRRWKLAGARWESIRVVEDGVSGSEDEAGLHWFAYGEFLSPRWQVMVPSALYVSRASVSGWRLDTCGAQVQLREDPAGTLDGVVLLISERDETLLKDAIRGSVPTQTATTVTATLVDGSEASVLLFAPSIAPAVAVMPKFHRGPDLSLPFFAYGLFKPGQLGYERLKPYVKKRSRSASVRGVLWERDGVPLLEIQRDAYPIDGNLIEFRKGQEEVAYSEIGSIEPTTQYVWDKCTVEVDGKDRQANVLAGRKPKRGGRETHESSWDGRQDPFFSKAIEMVTQAVEEARQVPPQLDDAEPLLRLQMAYGLLWASVERFCALRYSLQPAADKSVMQRISKLAMEPVFIKLLEAEPKEQLESLRRVYRSDDPEKDPTKLTRNELLNAGSTIRYLYQIRSNVLHRGKESLSDFQLTLDATDLLLRLFKGVLSDAFEKCSADT